jgi:hypothetical protein
MQPTANKNVIAASNSFFVKTNLFSEESQPRQCMSGTCPASAGVKVKRLFGNPTKRSKTWETELQDFASPGRPMSIQRVVAQFADWSSLPDRNASLWGRRPRTRLRSRVAAGWNGLEWPWFQARVERRFSAAFATDNKIVGKRWEKGASTPA